MNNEQLTRLEGAVERSLRALNRTQRALPGPEREQAEDRIWADLDRVNEVRGEIQISGEGPGAPGEVSPPMVGDDGGGTEANQEPPADGDSLRVTDSATQEQQTDTGEPQIRRRIVS